MNVNVKVKAKGPKEVSHKKLACKAKEATWLAYERALSSSQGVLLIKDGHLVRVLYDGTKELVAKAEPRRKVKVGKAVLVRRADGKESRSASA